jgi:hypothetical protein
MDDFRVFLDALAPAALAGGSSLLLCGELTGDCAITASDALQILRIAVGIDEHTSTCNA